MSIEKTLIRIADSLEILAGAADDKAIESFAATIPPKEEAAAPKAAAPKAAPAAPKAAAPKAAPAAQMTLEDLNAGLVAEYNRLNKDRTLIEGVIKGFCGGTNAAELKPTDYQAVLDKVKGL